MPFRRLTTHANDLTIVAKISVETVLIFGRTYSKKKTVHTVQGRLQIDDPTIEYTFFFH